MPRPRVTLVLAIVMLSALIALVTAVVCAMRVDLRTATSAPDMRPSAINRMAAIWRARHPAETPARWLSGGDEPYVTATGSVGYTLRYLAMDEPAMNHGLMWAEAGWPCVALHGAYWRLTSLAPDPSLLGSPRMITGRTIYSDGLVTVPSQGIPLLDYDTPRFVPKQVVWSGLMANTLVNAVAIWIALTIAWQLRRRHRRRRGRCPACGYPVGGSEVCAECGARIASPGVPAATIGP